MTPGSAGAPPSGRVYPCDNGTAAITPANTKNLRLRGSTVLLVALIAEMRRTTFSHCLAFRWRWRIRSTSSERSDPNANTPNGPASGRGAHPSRSLGAPVRSAERRGVRPGSPWLGGAGRLVPRRRQGSVSRRLSEPSCACQPPSVRWPECARQRLIQPERAQGSGVPVSTGGVDWGGPVQGARVLGYLRGGGRACVVRPGWARFQPSRSSNRVRP